MINFWSYKDEYKIYADKIEYFKEENKIITEGNTEGLISNDYKIETEDLILLRNEMLFLSDKQIKFYNESKNYYLYI